MKTLSLEQMENTDAGKMSCGVALGLWGIAFVFMCATTGPLAVGAVIALGASSYDYFEACAPGAA